MGTLRTRQRQRPPRRRSDTIVRVVVIVVVVVFVLGTLLTFGGGARSAPSRPDPASPWAAVAAQDMFDEPRAVGTLTRPVVFSTTFVADPAPARVELLTRIAGATAYEVREATVEPVADGSWTASVTESGFVYPNTTREFRFRAVMPGGDILGPAAEHTLMDDRFEWRSMSDDVVTLHWYAGDEAFARRALEIGVRAIDRAADLLGVAEVAPVDFFVYDTNDALHGALAPGSREYVAGQANAGIRTMVAAIGASQVDSDWFDSVVTHELTHMVFADASANPYHAPPRWLNEGLAVYLSDGYGVGDRAQVADAAGSGRLIPLSGLADLFPSGFDRNSLAYAESVSAVDHLIDAYGEDTLARLITSYRAGVTDEEAFLAATGLGFRAFDDAWIAAQGATRIKPYGPRPAPPGIVPAAWATASPLPVTTTMAP
jgi:hypothetical protein